MVVLNLIVAPIVISIEVYDISSILMRRPLWALTHAYQVEMLGPSIISITLYTNVGTKCVSVGISAKHSSGCSPVFSIDMSRYEAKILRA